jgi:hypothetical protein
MYFVPNQATKQLTIKLTALRVVDTKTQHSLWRQLPSIWLTVHERPTKYTLDVQ